MKYLIYTLLLTLSLSASTKHTAKVLEVFPSAGYSYMKVQENKKEYWIAMLQRDIKVGATIAFSEEAWMKDFHSKTLNRTFDSILFASDTQRKTTPAKQTITMKPDIMVSSYKAKGTISIAKLFKDRVSYGSKEVSIRGIVTKTSQGIMKRNWVHLWDGSLFQNMNDLVLTTTQPLPKVGEVVTLKGTVTLDKDFGFGYFYPVIVEKASF
ncbi:MAG: hypothetical protein ACI9TV_002580 [Sulfurimonas sp.]|jgi:hypothetical protein|uniref:hypothetical protein n=1 Tax=Sulfurimonas sp. TaxID=2022749 RepID=UPI0039E596E4